MKRRSHGPSKAPRALRRKGVRLDNITLMPATPTPLYQVLRQLAPAIRARGRHITALRAESLA